MLFKRLWMKWRLASITSFLVLLFILGCGNSGSIAEPMSPTASKPDPVVTKKVSTGSVQSSNTDPLDGETIFAGLGGCGACHTIEGLTVGGVGPELTHIGTDAGSRKPGLSASKYIEESIRSPEAFVAEGVERAMPGLMTSGITAHLTDGQVEALVEFLMSKK